MNTHSILSLMMYCQVNAANRIPTQYSDASWCLIASVEKKFNVTTLVYSSNYNDEKRRLSVK